MNASEDPAIAARVQESLMSNSYVKAIAGASITDQSHILTIAAVYTAAEATAIDVNPEPVSVQAALAGRWYGQTIARRLGWDVKPPAIVASVAHEADCHRLKARIDTDLCIQCGICRQAHVCTDAAITEEFVVRTAKCRGCGWCSEICPAGAAQLYAPSLQQPVEALVRDALDAGADVIEIHASGLPEAEVRDTLSTCAPLLMGRIASVCLFSSRTAPRDVPGLVTAVTETLKGCSTVIIQADGAPMSGGGGERAPGLQAIATGEMVRDAIQDRPNAFVQLSGGVTAATPSIARRLGLEFAGYGVGKEALAIIKDCLGSDGLRGEAALRAIRTARRFVSRFRPRGTRAAQPRATSLVRERRFVGPGMLDRIAA